MEHYIIPIHPAALAFTLLSGLLMLLLPRRAAIVPLMFAVVFMPMQQRILIASLDFYILRILVLFGWLRIITRSEYHITLNKIDKAMIWYVISGVVAYTLLWRTGDAFINRLGISFDIIGIYFLVRFLVRDYDDIAWVVKTLAIISIPVAIAMVIEWRTGRNPFFVFGGVPEFTPIRDGKLRCQGAFGHPITAGSFGAALVPMFYYLRHMKGYGRFLMISGIISATFIMLTSSSSGPALAYIAGFAALTMWHFRNHMRLFRWGLVFTLIFLHIVMKAPVWALIMKIKVFGASTAYHRFHLVDQFINRVGEWWLVGVHSTGGWGYYLFDVTNQFVRVGVDGGMITLALFIAILSYSFQSVGRAVKSLKETPAMQKVMWGLGASLFVHIISFMGVSYWDQIKVIFYMLIALISVSRAITDKAARVKKSAAQLVAAQAQS